MPAMRLPVYYMQPKRPNTTFERKKLLLPVVSATVIFLFMLSDAAAQKTVAIPKTTTVHNNLFGAATSFIENIGQYGDKVKGFEAMGSVQYGYEGMSMPVLFTPKGIIHLQRKVEKISHEEEERLERKGIPEKEIEKKKIVTDKVITMEWLNASADVQVIAEEKETAYHGYGTFAQKAYGYKRLVYKNMYPGIDIVYSFIQNDKPGFEYSLIVHPGADLDKVKLKYGGDVKTIKTTAAGNIIISSGIDEISSSIPVSYYGDRKSVV